MKALPLGMPQSWLWGIQIAVEKSLVNLNVNYSFMHDFRIREKVWREYCNQFGIYQCFCVSLLTIAKQLK